MMTLPPEIVALFNGAAAFVAALLLGYLTEFMLKAFGIKVDLSPAVPALATAIGNIALILFAGFLLKAPASIVPILLQIIVAVIGVLAAHALQRQRLELKRYRALAPPKRK